MNEDSDYVSILGNVRGVYPSKVLGRGLIKKDKIYEFQSAHPFHPERMSEYINIICEKLKSQAKVFADPVPTLPDIVRSENINSRLKSIDMIPLGIDKNTLAISSWDFKNNVETTISALEIENMSFFLNPFINQFNNLDCTMFVFDALEAVDNSDFSKNIIYLNEGFNKVLESIHTNLKNQYDAYVKSNYNKSTLEKVKPGILMIIGIEELLNKLNDDNKKKYEEVMKFTESIQTLKIILVDTVDIFKKIEYDNWYKMVAKNSQGIWLGNGIAEQYALKITKVTRELQQDVPKTFGYIIRRGNANLTKFLSSIEEE